MEEEGVEGRKRERKKKKKEEIKGEGLYSRTSKLRERPEVLGQKRHRAGMGYYRTSPKTATQKKTFSAGVEDRGKRGSSLAGFR